MEHPPPWTPAPEAIDEPSAGLADATPSGPEVVAGTPGAPDAVITPDGRPSLDLDAVTVDLAAVEAALERLEQGGYGRCGACASTIDDDVLAADPTATTCAAHLPV